MQTNYIVNHSSYIVIFILLSPMEMFILRFSEDVVVYWCDQTGVLIVSISEDV